MSTVIRHGAALASAVAVSLLVVAPSAAAPPRHEQPGRITRSTTTDPPDTRGPLDIARVTHRIAVLDRHRVSIAYTLRTYDTFQTRELSNRRRNFTIELATDASPGASHNILVYSRHGRLSADLISNATRERVARLHVRRVGPRGVRVSGPRRLIGARRYFAYSRYERRHSSPCGMVGGHPITCGDSVPDHGWLRMDRPAWPQPSHT